MATSPSANPTPITPPRVPLIDERTGLVDRAWYQFFLSIFRTATNVVNEVGLGPDTNSLLASADAALRALALYAETLPPPVDTTVDITKIRDEGQLQPPAQVGELQQQIDVLRQMFETLPQPALGSMAALQQDNLPWVTFDTTPQSVPTVVGTVAWDGGTTLGLQATTNVNIKVGETEFVYVRASSAITKGQLCYHTGSVGSSGVITAAPTPIGLADPTQIVGVAAESIALNSFGLIQISGDLRGFNTTGSSVGEVWADGDPLYYNPAFVGSFTKTKPSAPNQKTYAGEVINAGSGGSGSINVRIIPGSVLGGTDSNVQFSTLADKDLIQYDSVLQYWKNVAPSSISVGTATNLAGGLAGSVPYQTAPNTTTFLGIGTAAQVLKVNAGATAPEWVSGAALSKTDDTNVTLTLGGSPSTALLAATSLTLGWTGQLAMARGGTNANLTASAGSIAYSTSTALALNTAGNSGDWLKSGGTSAPTWTAPAALTETDDTNVTLTLGGSPSTALLNSVSMTLGWTGQLAISRGGTNGTATPTAGAVAYGTGTAYDFTAVGSANQVLISNGAAAPSWAALSSLGVTSISFGTTGLTPSSPTTGSVTVAGTLATTNGGTGLTSFTANGIVYASSTSALATGTTLNFNGTYLGLGVAASTGQYGFRQSTTGSGTTVQYGYFIDAFSNSSATSATAAIRARARTSAAAYTCAAVYGFVADDPGLGLGSTITTAVGMLIQDHTVGSNNRGLVSQVSSGANKHNIYASGTASNYFAGGVNVGATADPGANNLWVSGNISIRGSGTLGYGTGSGGAVTQATSRTTGVTLDKTNGSITLVSAAGTTTWQSFTVTNNTVAISDTVIVSQRSGTDLYQIFVTNVAAGSFQITFATTGGTTTEQPVFNFAVIKAVTA